MFSVAATITATLIENPATQTLLSVLPEPAECRAMREAKGCCFAAGTEVKTEGQDIPIENIHEGERVLAKDVVTDRQETERVTDLTPPHLDSLVELRIEGERLPLKPSKEHPFWVQRGAEPARWIEAGSLPLQDHLLTMKGEWRAVTAIAPVAGQQTVYNFTVAKDRAGTANSDRGISGSSSV